MKGLQLASADTKRRVASAGGLAISKNREHMRELGRRGGRAVSKNKEHMSQIGRKGGAVLRKRAEEGFFGKK